MGLLLSTPGMLCWFGAMYALLAAAVVIASRGGNCDSGTNNHERF